MTDNEPTYAVYLVLVEDTNRAFEKLADAVEEYNLIDNEMTYDDASRMVATAKVVD